MKQKRIPLVGRQYLVPFILITSLFFLWGFAHAILNVLNKHFQEILDITKTHSAFIQMTMYMGYFIMAIPAGFFISRFGYRRGVVFGLLLYGVGSLLFIPGQHYLSFNLFLFALFVIGCGLTFLETAANPYATELGAKETAASRLNFAQSFNGLGCICAPVLAGLLLFSKDGVVKVGDFGLAMQLNYSVSARSSIHGTDLYMGPEVYAGQCVLKSDVWSLGMSMIEIAEGRHPFAGMNSFQVAVIDLIDS